jgi:molybdopterin molybdotransferase
MYLSVKDARSRLLEALSVLPAESIGLQSANGRVLAQDLVSSQDLPPFSNSSMDGFALQAADLVSADSDAPILLNVVADIPAGRPLDLTIERGQAARIMTGAPLPAGADAVVPVEDTDFGVRDAGSALPETVRVHRRLSSGDYVRPRGQDISAGQVVLRAGTRMRAQHVGMAAMLGLEKVPVYRRPRVAVVSTGDELLPVGSAPESGKIFESNAHTLSALIESAGGIPVHLGIADDREAAVRGILDHAIEASVDLVLSSAGVSVGVYDYVRTVVESHGHLNFWRVNMRPGKPLAFGDYRGVPFVGLPGNPVSAFVGFEVFVRSALARMAGEQADSRVSWRGTLAHGVDSDGRESYLRATLIRDDSGWRASLTGHQGSGNQFSLVQADALIIIPAGVTRLEAGQDITIWPLNR